MKFAKITLIASLIVGCSFVSNAFATQTNQKVLRVGTESSYAPFEFTQNDKLVGFDIDIMEAVAKQMGYKVDWSPMGFDGLIPAMLTGQLDVACASFTITPERAKRIDFSDPYYRSGLTFIVRKNDLQKYPTSESLKGKPLCAQLGSVSAMKAQKISPDKVTTFSDVSAAYLELNSGGCEAVINDRPVNQYFLATSKLASNFVELDEILDAEDMAIAISKNKDELKANINNALQEIRDNGEYQAIYDKWFSSGAKK